MVGGVINYAAVADINQVNIGHKNRIRLRFEVFKKDMIIPRKAVHGRASLASCHWTIRSQGQPG